MTGYIDLVEDALQAKRRANKEEFARVWGKLKLLVEGEDSLKAAEVAGSQAE
ncbi:MAG: hypothetical protein MI924_09865 [Chloroflexales bacterium]|nr:hypothetical protein [Chloroflexales bacterium]